MEVHRTSARAPAALRVSAWALRPSSRASPSRKGAQEPLTVIRRTPSAPDSAESVGKCVFVAGELSAAEASARGRAEESSDRADSAPPYPAAPAAPAAPACPGCPSPPACGNTASCHCARGRALGKACASSVSTRSRAIFLSKRCQPACETANPRGVACGAAVPKSPTFAAELAATLAGYWAAG